MNKRIGINLPSSAKLETLSETLSKIEEWGFSVCELNLSSFPFIMGDHLIMPVIKYVKKIFDQHHLEYSAHGSYGLDLKDLSNIELKKLVLRESVDVCELLGCKVLNVHNEFDTKRSIIEDMFAEEMYKAADYAQKKGILIVVENVEVENVYRTVEMVQRINHPNLGMNLDLGHLFLSANYFGYDYLQAVKDCIPYIRHLHIHDNNGEFEMMRLEDFNMYKTLSQKDRMVFSSGDMHVPPFWCKAPLKEALKMIKDSGYNGIWLCEYLSDLFVPFNKQIRADVEDYIENA